ncbi:MAG: hypothetical protein H5T86_09855 [Armatimonadetes bacterium]|nr:hypothetical protein [Armatimonadota bacterium]
MRLPSLIVEKRWRAEPSLQPPLEGVVDDGDFLEAHFELGGGVGGFVAGAGDEVAHSVGVGAGAADGYVGEAEFADELVYLASMEAGVGGELASGASAGGSIAVSIEKGKEIASFGRYSLQAFFDGVVSSGLRFGPRSHVLHPLTYFMRSASIVIRWVYVKGVKGCRGLPT